LSNAKSGFDGTVMRINHDVTPQGTIVYMDGFVARAEHFLGPSRKWNEYLTVSNVMVGVRFVSGGTTTMHHFHTDHLGSISAITDQSETVLERLSYDAWGKRRFANGADNPRAPSPARPRAASPTRRNSASAASSTSTAASTTRCSAA
jgi:hypothetical protein